MKRSFPPYLSVFIAVWICAFCVLDSTHLWPSAFLTMLRRILFILSTFTLRCTGSTTTYLGADDGLEKKGELLRKAPCLTMA
jgi:hypothetical protein